MSWLFVSPNPSPILVCPCGLFMGLCETPVSLSEGVATKSKRIVYANRMHALLNRGLEAADSTPSGWWPPAWDEHVQSGDWGAVVATKHGVVPNDGCYLEAHLTAVPHERVKPCESLTTLPAERLGAASHDNVDGEIKGVPHAIHWLNTAADWPHDVAYVMSRQGIWFRLRRIRGRRERQSAGAPDEEGRGVKAT